MLQQPISESHLQRNWSWPESEGAADRGWRQSGNYSGRDPLFAA